MKAKLKNQWEVKCFWVFFVVCFVFKCIRNPYNLYWNMSCKSCFQCDLLAVQFSARFSILTGYQFHFDSHKFHFESLLNRKQKLKSSDQLALARATRGYTQQKHTHSTLCRAGAPDSVYILSFGLCSTYASQPYLAVLSELLSTTSDSCSWAKTKSCPCVFVSIQNSVQ